MRPLRAGEFAFVRVKVTALVKEPGWGEYELEPITATGQPVIQGKYLYADRAEIITLEEARRAVSR